MREDYKTYINRIHELTQNRVCFPPEWEDFCTAPGLNKKVTYDGDFKPFFGDTTVFPLSTNAKEALVQYQTQLYRAAGWMLSGQLPADTFHITLHDLSADEAKENIEQNLIGHRKPILEILSSVQNRGKIRLKSSGIVSMVASSLVMLFEPVSHADHALIQEIYGMVDEVLTLSYPLTLHCTLAYYKPGVYAPEEWNILMHTVTELNQRESVEIELDCSALEYQHFDSMKEYNLGK